MFLSFTYLVLLLHYALGAIQIDDVRANKRNSINACVMTIANKNFKYGQLMTFVLSHSESGRSANTSLIERVLLSNLYNEYKWTVLTRGASKTAPPHPFEPKTRMYIIQIRDGTEINSTLQYLQDITWNPRAKFVIITSHVFRDNNYTVRQITETLWSRRALNVIFLLPQQENPGTLDVYTWFPYEGDNCADRFDTSKVINRCTNGTFETDEVIFPVKIPENLHGCPLRVRAIMWPPYVIAPDVYNRSDIGINFTKGIEISLLNTVGKKMNVTLVYTLSKKTFDWGVITPDGNFTGLFYELIMKNVDIGVGSTAATSYRFNNFDYTLAYTTESLAWCVPRALLKPKWLSIFYILTPQSWLYVCLTYVMVAFFTWTLAYWYDNESTSYKSQGSCWLNMFAVLISVSVNRKPRLYTVQALFLLWCIFSLNLTVVYQTYLINFLVQPNYQRQVKTIDEVFETKMPFGFLYVSRFYFGKSDSWIQQKLIKDGIICYDADECLNNVAIHRNFSFAVPRLYLEHTESKYKDIDGRSLMYIFQQDYILYPVLMYTYRGFPLLSRINQIISYLKQTGIQQKWESDLKQMFSNESTISTVNEQDDEVAVLTLVQLQGAFTVFVLGVALAVVVFLMELIAFKIKYRNVRKPFIH